MSKSEETVEGRWVAGRYEGERAKSIWSHIKEGVGYYELSSGPGWIIAAFVWVEQGNPLPPHLEFITDPLQQMKLDKLYKQRHGGQRNG